MEMELIHGASAVLARRDPHLFDFIFDEVLRA